MTNDNCLFFLLYHNLFLLKLYHNSIDFYCMQIAFLCTLFIIFKFHHLNLQLPQTYRILQSCSQRISSSHQILYLTENNAVGRGLNILFLLQTFVSHNFNFVTSHVVISYNSKGYLNIHDIVKTTKEVRVMIAAESSCCSNTKISLIKTPYFC